MAASPEISNLAREQEKLVRQTRIMNAAEQVFLERGMNTATMDQIAQAAQLSKGTLYLYFKNKDDLYLAIATRALSELVDIWQSVKDASGYESGFELYKSLLEVYLEYALEHPDRFRVTLGWSAPSHALQQDLPAFGEYQRLLQVASAFGYDALELGKRDGSVRDDLDTASTTFHVWGGTVGMLMMLYGAEEINRRLPAPVDFNKALTDHVAALLSSLQTPQAPGAFPERLSAFLNQKVTNRG